MTVLDTGEWVEDLHELMLTNPGRTGGYYARALRNDRYFYDVRKHDVNRLLYSSEAFQRVEGEDAKPAWYLADRDVAGRSNESVPQQRRPTAVERKTSADLGAGSWSSLLQVGR